MFSEELLKNLEQFGELSYSKTDKTVLFIKKDGIRIEIREWTSGQGQIHQDYLVRFYVRTPNGGMIVRYTMNADDSSIVAYITDFGSLLKPAQKPRRRLLP